MITVLLMISCFAGTLNIPSTTAVGGNIDVTDSNMAGIDSAAKGFVLFTWNGQTTLDFTGSAAGRYGMGYGIGLDNNSGNSTDQGGVTSWSTNGNATSVEKAQVFDDNCVKMLTGLSVDSSCKFISFITNGFRLQVTAKSAVGFSYKVGYLAIWCNDSSLKVESKTITPSLLGDTNYTSFSFQPDGVILLATNNLAGINSITAPSSQSIGFVDRALNNLVMAVGSVDGVATTNTGSWCRRGYCLAQVAGNNAMNGYGSLTAWVGNGFTITMGSGFATLTRALVIKGIQMEVFTGSTLTTASSFDVSDLGFLVKGMVVASSNKVEASSTSTAVPSEWSVGFGSNLVSGNTSGQCCYCTLNKHGATTTAVGVTNGTVNCYLNLNASLVREGVMADNFQTFGAINFNMNVGDIGTEFFGGLAFGDHQTNIVSYRPFGLSGQQQMNQLLSR